MAEVRPSTITLTFVFTDIEASTRLLRRLGDDYSAVLRTHDGIIRNAASEHRGTAFGSEGDAQFLAFRDPLDAVKAAAAAQRSLTSRPWSTSEPVRVRMGIHTGTVQQTGDRYVGMALHETARITAAGHGGQVLLSAATTSLVGDVLPEGLSIADLGEHQLKDFDQPVRIAQLDVVDLETTFPPLRSQSPVQARLPTPVTSFVGREEVGAIVDLAREARLVTLTGPGGTGKTRLSIEVAAEIAGDFDGGTFFVALDAVTDADLVASEVASTLGLAAGQGAPLERLTAYLHDRNVLLVLDNMEQVVDAAAAVAQLLRECPGVSFIITSRIPLRISGEHEFPVPALAIPPSHELATASALEGYESVRLFVTRARTAKREFVLDDANAETVVDIVSRLDGLPLAIELAAARLRMLPLEALRQRLDDRLSTLIGGARDLPGRQRTLRGTIEWSHDLLDESDRRFFARFSVIAGSAAVEQIEAVGAAEAGEAVFERLESLHDQSLLRSIERDGEARFAMLATIREYAAERLTESDENETVHRRHAEAYLVVAEAAESNLIGPDAAAWNDRLEAEHDNLRAALDWTVDNDEGELGLRMASALWRFWQVRGHLHEGAERLDRVLAMPSETRQSTALRSRTEVAAGSIAYWRSDVPGMHQHYSRALAHARTMDDPALLAQALYNQGFAPTGTDWSQIARYREGRPYFEEALELYREIGDRGGEASALWALSQSAMAIKDAEKVERLGVEALEVAREVEIPFLVGWAAFTLGLDRMSRDSTQGIELLEESLEVFAGSGDIGGVTLTLTAVAMAAHLRGDEATSWRLLGTSTRARDDSGTNLLNEDVSFGAWDPHREPETEDAKHAYEDGRQMGTDDAIALARSVIASYSATPAEPS